MGVCGGVVGRLGRAAFAAADTSEELPPDSERFGEYKSSTWWQMSSSSSMEMPSTYMSHQR